MDVILSNVRHKGYFISGWSIRLCTEKAISRAFFNAIKDFNFHEYFWEGTAVLWGNVELDIFSGIKIYFSIALLLLSTSLWPYKVWSASNDVNHNFVAWFRNDAVNDFFIGEISKLSSSILQFFLTFLFRSSRKRKSFFFQNDRWPKNLFSF